MKKLYTLGIALSMVAFGTQSMAQVKVQSIGGPSITQTAVIKPSAKKMIPSTPKDDLTVYFSEDFSNGFDGQGENGPWTTGEDQGNLWFQTFPVGETNGYSTTEAVLDGNHPEYQDKLPLFFGSRDVVSSPTRSNGVMMFDIDRWNSLSTVETPLSYDPQNPELSRTDNMAHGTLISPSFDLTGVDNALLTFYQRIRLCCGPAYTADVELSVDGGNTWIMYDVFNPYGEGNDDIDIQVSLNISDVLQDATDLSDCKVRFNWNGIETSTYYWSLDDVQIVELPANDLIAGKTYINNWSSMLPVDNIFEEEGYSGAEYYSAFEYYNQPEYYTRPYNFGMDVVNGGAETQTDVILTVTGNAPSGATHTWTSTPVEIESGVETTLWINNAMLTDFESGEIEIGQYTFNFEVSQAQVDSRPEDNVGTTRQSTISDESDNIGAIMRNDANNYAGAYTTRGQDIIWNTSYVFPELADGFEPKFITHVEVVFLNSPGFAATIPGEVVYFNVRKNHPYDGLDEAVFGNDPLFYEDEDLEHVISEAELWTSGAFIWTAFELPNPVAIEPGVIYNAEMRIPAAGSGIAFLPVTSPQEDISSIFYDYAEGTWYYTGTNAMPLRFRTGSGPNAIDKITVESGLTLVQNYPNPFTDMTKIQYILDKSNKVSFEVRDITGKLVYAKDLGNVPANAPQTFELQRGNLAPGMYTYTIATPEFQVSRKLTVQ